MCAHVCVYLFVCVCVWLPQPNHVLHLASAYRFKKKKNNTISHLLWDCRKQFETSSTCVVYFIAYPHWIKSACPCTCLEFTASKYNRLFQFAVFSPPPRLPTLNNTLLSFCKMGHHFLFLSAALWDFNSFPSVWKCTILRKTLSAHSSASLVFFVTHSWQSTRRFLICYSFLFHACLHQKPSNVMNKWSK